MAMGDDGRVTGDPTEVLTRSGGSSYVSLTVEVPTSETASAPAMDATAPPPAPPASRLRLVGWLALALAVAAAVLTAVAVGSTADGAFETGTALAWTAIVVSGVAVVGGMLAVVAGFARIAGAVAIALGLLANPFLLTQLLGAVQQLSAAAAATT
jgi:hypothetical protein